MPAQMIITVLVVAVAGLLLLTTVVGNKQGMPQSPSQQEQKTTLTGTPAPTAVQAGTVKGTVVSLTGDTLVVAQADGNKSVSIAGTADFQKVLSGSLEGGTAVFAMAVRSDLAPGKEVLIAIDEKKGTALTVIILN